MSVFRRRPRHRHHTGISPFKAGLIGVVIVTVFSYWAYTQVNPFSNPFELKAVFETGSNLKSRSPVRIAGVNVGEVTGVEPVGDEGAARVTMEIEEKGLPIHRDAEVKIRPRIFLEGNFFVEVQPGSPSAPTLDDGDEIPLQQTATPIQFADVLAALQSDTRSDLQRFLKEFSSGLKGKGAEGLNQVYRYGEDAYRFSAQVNEATLGTREHDLSRLVRGQARTFRALARNEEDLKGLVTNFNTFAAALAREDRALEATIPALDDVLRVASPALDSLNSSLPSVRAFARDALPGTRSSGPTLDANLPFIKQARRLVSRAELRGLVDDLRPTVPDLAQLNKGQIGFMAQSRALSACQNNVLVPFAQTPIPHPDFPENTNQPFYKQAPRGLVGLAGESRIHDANSQMFHFQFGSGPLTLVQPGEDGSQTFGVATFPPLGVRPARPNRRPDDRPDIPCETQDPPNLEAPGGPADARVVNASAKPRTAAARARTAREAQALELLVANLKKHRAGKLRIDPLLATERQVAKAAEEKGARR